MVVGIYNCNWSLMFNQLGLRGYYYTSEQVKVSYLLFECLNVYESFVGYIIKANFNFYGFFGPFLPLSMVLRARGIFL